jgi:hypothetical protein
MPKRVRNRHPFIGDDTLENVVEKFIKDAAKRRLKVEIYYSKRIKMWQLNMTHMGSGNQCGTEGKSFSRIVRQEFKWLDRTARELM